ncbi:MAG: diguanylate cyclase, partial [Oscillospiraceae bacterium]|nr:diguanylate cyclase [Oscillospiraceae bacterium]
DNDRSIEAYRYLEYAEVWFDENSIATAARKIHTDMREKDSTGYEIMMGRYDDHLMLRMTSPGREKELVVALANGVKSAYLALTGEHCVLRDISVRQTGITVKAGDIPRIAAEVSFIARMESDIRNVQINRTRSAHTEGIELNKRLKLMFHTMTLPGADLVWHCPYVVIFSSADGSVHGDGYREYALIKFCGENECSEEYAHNSISIRKGPDFPGWDEWKNNNSRGYECEVLLERKGSRIVTRTCNFGVQIENTTEIYEMPERIYAALTGDQVALTDIRIKR